jgi:hypothetical protein
MLRIRDFYPGSRVLLFIHSGPGSRIQQQQQKGGGEFVVLPFFVATNITKLLLSSQKYGFAIEEPEKTDPGSRTLGPGSATLALRLRIL